MRIAEIFSSPLRVTTFSSSSSSSSSSRIHPSTSSYSSSSSSKFSKGLNFLPRKKNKRSSTFAIRAVTNDVWSSNHHALPARKIGKNPEPPWPVLPPPPPKNPFTDQNLLLSVPVGIGIPISLRLIQMKKRLEHVAPPLSLDDMPENSPVAKAVSALLFTIEELQKNLNDGVGDTVDCCDGMAIDRASRDRRDCFSWLFRRVFANSPNIVPLVLLVASFVAISAEKTTTSSVTLESPEEEIQEEVASGKSSLVGSFGSWYDIGIKEGFALNYRRKKEENEETSEERRRRAYERAIAEGEASSLILCNYAQFLHQVDHDHERSERYFQLAAMAEPKDAEAISKYAFFLWEQRGDASKAEDLFLEAIDVEPESFYHSRNYAWFLWETGAEDTCFPLSSPPFSR